MNKGHNIFIGPSYEINSLLDVINPQIYISKDPSDKQIRRKLQEEGAKFCGISTEGQWAGGSLDQYTYGLRKSIKSLDCYFAWGDIYKDSLEKKYGNLSNVYVTGNPRFDLLTENLRSFYDSPAEELKNTYNEFILINTNFAYANPFNLELDKKSRSERLVEGMNKDRLTTESRMYHLFIDLIHRLSNSGLERTIVVRPHPGENHDKYVEEFTHHDNVVVNHSGDVRAWIHAASVVIHYNCTTGIEAALMNTPVVAYDPIKNPNYTGLNVPQKVSKVLTTPCEVEKYIKSSTTEHTVPKEGEECLNRFMKNTDGSAAKKITKIIDNMVHEESVRIAAPNFPKKVERQLKSTGVHPYAKKLNDIYLEKKGENIALSKKRKADQKFPGLSKAEISDGLSRFPIEKTEYSIKRLKKSNHTFHLYPT